MDLDFYDYIDLDFEVAPQSSSSNTYFLDENNNNDTIMNSLTSTNNNNNSNLDNEISNTINRTANIMNIDSINNNVDIPANINSNNTNANINDNSISVNASIIFNNNTTITNSSNNNTTFNPTAAIATTTTTTTTTTNNNNNNNNNNRNGNNINLTIMNNANTTNNSDNGNNTRTTITKPFTSISTSSTKPNQHLIPVKHQLCRPCKAQIGINLTHPFERSAFLHSLLNGNGSSIHSSHERMVHDYVDKGIGNPMAIAKYLIEKRWFADYTSYSTLETDNQSILEKDRRMLALEMWVRNRIDSGNILSPRNDSEHPGKAPPSLWPMIDQILTDFLSRDTISSNTNPPPNEPEYIEINSEDEDQRPVILIND